MGIRDLIEDLRVFLYGDDLFEMANLGPARTGLRYHIWISHRGRARHAPRVKVYPEGYDAGKVIVVSVGKDPVVLEKSRKLRVPQREINKVFKYVRQNEEVIQRFWKESEMDVSELLDELKPI